MLFCIPLFSDTVTHLAAWFAARKNIPCRFCVTFALSGRAAPYQIYLYTPFENNPLFNYNLAIGVLVLYIFGVLYIYSVPFTKTDDFTQSSNALVINKGSDFCSKRILVIGHTSSALYSLSL